MRSNHFLKGLRTRSFGHSALFLKKTESTNDVALQLARDGAPEGTLVNAESQTKGRGRMGRSWATTPGKSLAFSILLWPRLRNEELPEITLAAAVAVARTLEGHRLKPRIKWPNDILLDGKKVCGILTETGPKKDKMVPVVLGVGINLNQAGADFPKEIRGTATSFYRSSGRKVDRRIFLQKLLFQLEETYHWVVERRFPKVLGEWRKRSSTLGHQVKVVQPHRSFYGQAVDIDEKGALLVRNDIGQVERVTSGDVEALKIHFPPGNGKAK